MNVLVLCEGPAEEAHGSFSGITKSLVDGFRAAGHGVFAGDADLYGFDRWLGAALAFSPNRRRWGVRFHLGSAPFRLRTRRAARAIGAHAGRADCVLQIGATFAPEGREHLPYFLYCDSNVMMAERGRETGESQAAALSPAEVQAVAAREAGVYRAASRIFTLSERLRRSFVDDFGISPERVHAVYAGPNFDVERIPRAGARVESSRPPTVLFVGRQFARKGGDLLLAAFRRVRAEVPDARLLVVGPPNQQIDEPGVESLGFFRKDVPAESDRLVAAYRGADVFCLPSRYEPFGIVFLEAMFFGLPCVGPNAWAIPEMIRDGETGYLFPPDDEVVLAERLVRLLRDVPSARAMGEAGRRAAEERFTWRAVVERMTREMAVAMSGPR